ncbi:uncharacterized protein LOC135496655 isoform X2 [Lineus longissimus]|uniref:uncharacterized protein LOC135496655 isoform X2 n=1 Tax=Lineus longissimus TaxID=88925 RepID=UPI00315C5EF0
MKGHTFKITLGLIEEVLPGLDVYLRFTLARENLSPGAESTRGYFIERLDVLTKKPYEVWDRVPREFEIEEPEPPPPKIPPRMRKIPPLSAGKVNGAEKKTEKICDDAATARVSAPDDGDSNCVSANQTDSKLKPSVPPKPEHLVTLVRSRSRSRPRSGYYNHSRMKPPEADGGEELDSEEKDVTLGDVTLTGSEVKVEEEDGGYEPIRRLIGMENDSSAILDSNANIENRAKEDSPEISNFVEEESDNVQSPSRKLSSVSTQSQDSALGFNLDIPKIDCKSTENMLAMDSNCAINETPMLKHKPLVEPVVTGVGGSPPVLPKRPQFLTVAKPKVAAHQSPSSSPRLVRESSPSRSPHRITSEDVPPPLPPRKRVPPPVSDGQPEVPSSEGVGVEAPALPPLPPRPHEALGLLTQREAETEEEFVAWQRMISRSNIVEEEEEGDYDTIDKSDGEEGSKSAEKKKKKIRETELLGMIKRKFYGKRMNSRESLRESRLNESDATSYESYDDMGDHQEVNSSQENIIDPVLTSKENLTASSYSLTFPRYAKEEIDDQAMTLPRFRSFRKSKRKANKGSLDNVSLCQHGAANFSGELQYKGKYQWTRRFCIVTSDEFLCFKTERDSRPVLSFALKDFDVAYIEKEGKKHHVIRLSHPGFDTHLFSVDSKDRADMWIEQFNSIGRNLEKNRMSADSLDGIRTEDGSSTSTPSQMNSHNSLSNISQTSSTSDSADTHSYTLAPSMSGSQYSVTSMIVGSKESTTPSPLRKQTKRPLSTPSSNDVINRAIVLSNPSTPTDMKLTPSPSGQRHSAHHLSNQKSRRTSQLFGSWGKKKTKKSTPNAEPSAPINFEVYEGSSYDVSVSGYMNVKSQLSSHSPDWTRKYCRIKNGFFECYKDIADYRHEFNFPLVGCEILTAREAHHDLAIKVVQGDIEKVFIEPGNTLDQGRWLAVLIKETTCCSQPPPGSDDDDAISPLVLSPSSDNLDEKVFFENDVHSDPGSDGSDGYEQQAINRNSFDTYDRLKDSDSENSYIENYGPEVQAVREALTSGAKTVKNPDDGCTRLKEERLKSDSDIVVRPKSKVLDVYAKVEKRDWRFSALMAEEASSKRSSVASEYDDILSAVMKVSRKFSEVPVKSFMSRSLSFDTGKSLKAAAERVRDLDAIAAKGYESFQELHNSRQGSSERELLDSSGGTNSIEGAVISQDESSVITLPCGESETLGAAIDKTLSDESPIIHKNTGKTKNSGSHRPRSDVLYPEISNSFGSLDEISSDSSSDDDSSNARTLPNLDEGKEQTPVKFYESSDRKKDSGICGDSNESISALIKDEGAKVRDDAKAQLREHGEATDDQSEKRKTTDSIDKVLAGTFVNTATSVYAKEVPVNIEDSEDDKHSSHDGAEESDHEYDDIDEKKRNSFVPRDGATDLAEDSKLDNEDENVYDEIDKENDGEGQSSKVVVEVHNSKVVAIGDEAAKGGSEGHHDYADVEDKEKKEGVAEEESDHDYDPIEFKGATGEGAEGRPSSESEYEEYEDHEEESVEEYEAHEEESIESKQGRATALHAEVRVKKREWAQFKKLRLALENQRIQSRDPEEKKRLITEYNDLDEKIKVIEVELAAMVEEHRALSSAVTKHFQSQGLMGRKLSAISIESFMMTGK